MCVGMCECDQNSCGDQRTIWGSQFSPSGVRPGDPTQAMGLGGEHLLSHSIDSKLLD